MKRKRYIFLLLVLILMFINVNADETCDNVEFARLKNLARKIEFDYDYELVDDNVVFSINAINLNDDLKVLIIEDYYSDKVREFKGNQTGKLSGFKSGETVLVTIKGFVPNSCSGITILTKNIRLPYYNLYYDKEKCSGNEDFKYCKQLLNKNISQKDFDRQYELYLKSKEEKKIDVEEPVITKDFTIYYIIGGIFLIVIIVVLLIVYIVKKRKKNRL